MNEEMFYATLLIIILFVLLNNGYMQNEETFSPFDVIAHRGASIVAPENTIAAFQKAVEMKADFAELDVQVSRDGHLMVIHDLTVDRTTNGTGFVKDLSRKQLQQLDAGSWFHPSYKSERIPSLEEVINQFQGSIGLLIEMKNSVFYPQIEKKLIKLLKKYNLKNSKLIIQSFDLDSLKRVKKAIPTIETGLLINLHTEMTESFIKSCVPFVDYINPNFLMVNKKAVDFIHEQKRKTYPWTVYSKEEAALLLSYGVDGMVTNNPKLKKQLSNGKTFHHPYNVELVRQSNFLSSLKQINVDEFFASINHIIQQLFDLNEKQ